MTHFSTHNSLLVEPDRHPLRPAASVAELGTVAVFAPHPDDESLGCGGLLALLSQFGCSAHVIVVTDGSRSHPNSVTHPAPRLAAIREAETRAALNALGWPPEAATFLRFGDCQLPDEGDAGFAPATLRLHRILASLSVDTVIVPWRRDPHCDHEATWRLARAAIAGLKKKPRWLEYPVWAWMHPTTAVAPAASEATAWRLDITPVLARKLHAIAQHLSQMGEVVRDDPDGFTLQPAMLQHFARPWELFLEPTHG